jgi:RNA polymerase sigma factor (TIGR02999 family)
LPLVYEELHRLAHHQRRRGGGRQTLNTTSLLHEAYLKLVNQPTPSWQNRSHFFRVAAKAIRQILVDYARKYKTLKRGGDYDAVTLDEGIFLPAHRVDEVIAVHEALERLDVLDSKQSEIVELRYFVGFTIPETAEALGISPATVKREWTAARAWLHSELKS